ESFCDAPQFAIDLPDKSGLARVGLAVENSETWRRRALEGMNDQRGLALLSKRGDPLFIAANHALGNLLRRVRRQIGEVTPQLGCGLVGVHGQHDRIGREAIERTLSLEN